MINSMKFKVGDRVAVYHHSTQGKYYEPLRSIGIVLEVSNQKGFLNIEFKNNQMQNVYVHPKQCRLLKKKQRKSIWVEFHADGNIKGVTIFPDYAKEQMRAPIEMVEVKKK